MKSVWALILLCSMGLTAYAETMDFSTPEHEARYQALLPQIRCMICANQSIADSESAFAQNMRVWVHDAIEAGRTDMELRNDLIARFGETVFYQPSLRSSTYVLWGAPVFMILLVFWIWFRGRRA